jgi:phosphoglycerol transferase
MTPSSTSSGKLLRAAWPAGLALLLVYLTMRNTGLYPAVFADEWSYSSFARLTPLSESPLPSYLYLAVFGASNACGNAFLDCARGLNAVLFLGALPLIYAVARRVASEPVALLIALLTAISPINVYTTYFMPEASYFFVFWLLTWSTLRYCEQPDARRALALGVVFGMLSLIKVHALFLLPALLPVMLLGGWRAEGTTGTRLRTAAQGIALMLATAAVLRFGAGYLIAGAQGLSLSGTLYAGQSEYAAAHRKPLAQLLELAWINLRGHGMGLALMFGLPLAALAHYALSPAARRGLAAPASPSTQPTTPLALYTALTLLVMLAVTVLFTASVSGTGPSENMARLHMRYYNFALPLLAIFAATQLSATAGGGRGPRLAAALPCAALLLYGLFGLLPEFTPSYVDSPELRGLTAQPLLLRAVALLGLAALAAWVWRARAGAQVFLFLCLPLLAIGAGRAIDGDVAQSRNPDVWNLAGLYAHAHLTPAQRAGMTLVGADPAGLYKAKFHIDSNGPTLMPLPPGAVIDLNALKEDGWLLFVGDYAPPPYAVMRAREQGFTLYEQVAPQQAQRVDFRAASLAPVLTASTGLGDAEGWGRWSGGKLVTLQFAAPLPPHLTLRLTGRAFGPNAGRDVVVRIGAAERTLRFSEGWSKQVLNFDNAGGENAITLVVPQPVSPRALGLGDDGRELGLALVGLDVGVAPAQEVQPARSAQQQQQHQQQSLTAGNL